MNKYTTIYFDMDGVLADFKGGVKEICEPLGIDPVKENGGTSAEAWAEIKKDPDFYKNLKVLRGAKKLFDTVYGIYGDQCKILTALPNPDKGIENAAENKIEWAHKNINKDVEVITCLRKEKIDYCEGPFTVLVDDNPDTFVTWKEAGGKAVFCENPSQALESLRNMGLLNVSVDDEELEEQAMGETLEEAEARAEEERKAKLAKAEEAWAASRKPVNKKRTIIVLCAIVLAIAIALGITLPMKAKNYNAGIEAANSGDYKTAAEYFQKSLRVINYKHSDKMRDAVIQADEFTQSQIFNMFLELEVMESAGRGVPIDVYYGWQDANIIVRTVEPYATKEEVEATAADLSQQYAFVFYQYGHTALCTYAVYDASGNFLTGSLCGETLDQAQTEAYLENAVYYKATTNYLAQ